MEQLENINPDEFSRLIGDIDFTNSEQPFHSAFDSFEKLPFIPYKKISHPEFEKYFDFQKNLGVSLSSKFSPNPSYLYHGTNIDALNQILENGIMYPAIYLVKNGQLLSGELKQYMDRTGEKNLGGPKFLSRKKMVEIGMITPEDPHFYEFGHAGDICFGSYMGALGYTFEDEPSRKAILGIDKKVAEFNGAKFINGKSEGQLHEGALGIHLCLRELIVPDEKVEEYTEKSSSQYLVKVYPMSDYKFGEEE